MKKSIVITLSLLSGLYMGVAQQHIPLDTVHWSINAKSYVLESFKGQESIYLQGGSMTAKDLKFLNGTIEYDIFLKETPAFPGVYFRSNGSDAEQFYIRPHLSGKPDSNQAAAAIKGVTPWQLYFGPRYSFPYRYKYDDWTHVRLTVNGNRAQVYLDHSEEPHLSWNLFHEPKAGEITITGGNSEAMHIANVRIDAAQNTLKDFDPIERKPIDGLIQQWEVSDKFEESALESPGQFQSLIASRKWGKKIDVEEGTAANVSRQVQLRDETKGNTIFARTIIYSNRDQTKLFEFGYSDRVVALLNGRAMYRGTNKWRTRDYRYLGTVGLFDGIYLPLKKGKNTLLLAVSEDFGGWLVTGRFADPKGIRIEYGPIKTK